MSGDPLVDLVGLGLAGERDIDRERRVLAAGRGGTFDDRDDGVVRDRAGRVVERHRDDQALALAGHGEPCAGRVLDGGQRIESVADLAEQRHRLGGRVT